MRHQSITGNLSRGRQTPIKPNNARVPIVKATPTVTPKARSGNLVTRRNTTAKKTAGKTTQLAKPTTSSFR